MRPPIQDRRLRSIKVRPSGKNFGSALRFTSGYRYRYRRFLLWSYAGVTLNT